ncbi:YbjN domain-containing protein [Bacillus massiliglaciei]|uniref:YbjN domain-containing protein n=1 Tax=Bacillus massiliglaciei TaxID=1816693 RepID=UPI000DA61A1C|nr:YbjN domain-containing protein [Bacillus massiliglaciei]
MSNVAKFKAFLQREKIGMSEKKDEDGTTFFRAEQKLKDGWKVLLVIAFNPDESVADLFCFNVAEMKNPDKQADVHHLLNEFNIQFRYSKCYEENGIISLRYSYSLEGEFLPDLAFRKLIMLLETANEIYPRLMDTIWS